jgi:hypothetical protein
MNRFDTVIAADGSETKFESMAEMKAFSQRNKLARELAIHHEYDAARTVSAGASAQILDDILSYARRNQLFQMECLVTWIIEDNRKIDHSPVVFVKTTEKPVDIMAETRRMLG